MADDHEHVFEKILELALKDKLVLWAGAGLSREAGYPTGGELAEKLFERLSEEEKVFVPKELMKMSDYLVARSKNGRDELISILKDIFKIEPVPSESHQMIKKMAFFRTIITTNYDELFEDYIPGIEVIKTTNDLSRANSNSRKLIKIHGDLKSPKRVILTQNDYSALYERDFRDPFWNLIRVELTQKGVLFIGYGFNDPNVEGLFSYLSKKLKRHDHPKYLVAPNLTKDQQTRLETFGIHYFNQTGREFLQQLYDEVWKTKGHKYFGIPEVSTDALLHSLKEEGLPLSVTSKAKGGRLIQINPEPGKVWDLTFSTNDLEVQSRIHEWQKGLGADDLLISKDLLAEAFLKIGDFVIGDKDTIPEFLFQRIGHIEKDVRIVFENSGVEIFLQKVRSHRYDENGWKIIAENEYATLEIVIPEISSNGYSFNGILKPKEPSNSISGILNWHEAVFALGTGEPFIIFSSNLPKGCRQSLGSESQNLNILKRNKLIFKVLRLIEEKFRVRFSGLNESDIFNDKTLKELQNFLELFRTNRLIKNIEKGIPLRKISSNPDNDVIPMVQEAKDEGYFVLLLDVPVISFLGQDLKMGKKQVFIENPYLESSETDPEVLLLKSRKNICTEFMEPFGLVTFKEGVIEKSISLNPQL